MATLLLAAAPSTRAFGACLAGYFLIDLFLMRSRRFGQRPHTAGFLLVWSLQALLLVAAFVVLFFEPLH